jgi:hypothetical protein
LIHLVHAIHDRHTLQSGNKSPNSSNLLSVKLVEMKTKRQALTNRRSQLALRRSNFCAPG